MAGTVRVVSPCGRELVWSGDQVFRSVDCWRMRTVGESLCTFRRSEPAEASVEVNSTLGIPIVKVCSVANGLPSNEASMVCTLQ